MAYIGVSPSNGTRRVHTYTATASQTTFSGAGAEGATLSYKDSNFVDVYQNGVKLGDADYTATSGTSIVLGTGATVSDLVVIVVYDVFSVADTVSKADGGTFDGNVTMAGTLGVTGATTLTGGVSGDTTFTGDLTIPQKIIHSGDTDTHIELKDNQIDLTAGNVNIFQGVSNEVVINQGSADVNFRVEGNGDANLLVCDAGSDFVAIGETSQINGGKLNIATSASDAVLSFLCRSTTDSHHPKIIMQKSSTNSGNFASTADGELLGSIIFRGVNTSSVSDIGAQIIAVQNGTSGSTVPTDLVFNTTENERMRINSAGQVTLGGTSHADDLLYLTRSGNGKLLRFFSGSDEEGEISVIDNDGGGGILIGHDTVHLMINDNSARVVPSGPNGGTLDNAIALGASNRRFSAIFGASSSINTSDENEKQDIEALSATETKVAVACKGLIKKYRWKDAVAKKGNDARIHVGVIAQELKSAFEAEGLDASKYGMFCSDTWWEKDETIDGVISTQDYATEDKAPEGATKVTRLGVRYDELLAFIISAI